MLSHNERPTTPGSGSFGARREPEPQVDRCDETKPIPRCPGAEQSQIVPRSSRRTNPNPGNKSLMRKELCQISSWDRPALRGSGRGRPSIGDVRTKPHETTPKLDARVRSAQRPGNLTRERSRRATGRSAASAGRGRFTGMGGVAKLDRLRDDAPVASRPRRFGEESPLPTP